MSSSVRWALLLLPISIPTWLGATESPAAVSPGSSTRLVRTSDACPTFTWGKVAGAVGYELAVYRLQEDEVEEEPALRQALPGSVDGWTPSLDRCLEQRGRYAWSVRAWSRERMSSWSSPLLFEIVAVPSPARLEAALAVIRRHSGPWEETSASATSVSGDIPRRAPSSGRQETGFSSGQGLTTETRMSVDGGVVASSFTGDGGDLTGLNPALFTSGVADIDISGSSTLVNCFGCVHSIHIGSGQVQSIDIGDGEVKGPDIDSSNVQARVSGSCGSNGGIQAVASDGSPTCTSLTRILPGEEYQVSSLGGAGLKTKVVLRENRICLLTFVGMEDVTDPDEDASCTISEFTEPGTGTEFWVLEALAEGDADALCGMRCLEVFRDSN